MDSLPAMLIDENKALKARIAKLEAALDPFVRLEQAIMNDVWSAHSNRPSATEAMRDDDWDMRSDLRAAFKIARLTIHNSTR